MIKCIIFDCDGTLVDSEVLFNRALSTKLAERGVNLCAQQLVDRFRGVRLTTVLMTLQTEFSVELSDEFIVEYRVLVNELFQRELEPCVGVSQTLAQIDLPMCVATNGPLDKMKLALGVTNLAHYFGDHLFSAYEVGSWKPDPKLFLFAASAMGFNASECLVVEDSIVGIQAAKAAGMNALLYDSNRVHRDAGVTTIHHFVDVLEQLA